MDFQVGYLVYWINRGYEPPWYPENHVLFTDDGAMFTYGLGYSTAYDNVEAFELKLDESDDYLSFYWSEYMCFPFDPQGMLIWRPGGRVYASGNCNVYPWFRDPCYQPDVLPGTEECSWTWTGSYCFTMVYNALIEADPYFKFLKPETNAHEMLTALRLDHRGEEQEFYDRRVGDLIFMDFNDDGWYYEHVAVLSAIDYWPDFYADKCVGVIGFYSSPFDYKASEAAMSQFNSALDAEWYPFYPEDWELTVDRVRYIRLYEY